MTKLLERLEEPRLHSPVLEITRVPLEFFRKDMGQLLAVESEDVNVRERPVETEIFTEALRELGVLRVALMGEDEVVSEARPDQEVDDKGVFNPFL